MSELIKNWAPEDMPVNKAYLYGFGVLSNTELLSLIIGDLDKSREVLTKSKNKFSQLSKVSINDLMKIKGISSRKAVSILACLEIGRRRHCEDVLVSPIIKTASEIGEFIRAKYSDFNHEIFIVIYLNKRCKVIESKIISQGGITGTVADPRIIYKTALEVSATTIILAHNHPSGSVTPSRADEDLTRKIKEAGKYFDIAVMDHIIVGEEGYFSFADEGLL